MNSCPSCGRRLRMIAPAYPAFNVYSGVARWTTALGPLCVATVVSRMDGWDVEVIDENNYRRGGPRNRDGLPDHAALQNIRHADVAGFYGGLSSTVPRLYELARLYKQAGVITIAGGQHFAGENIRPALENGIDFVVTGEGEHTIRELLMVIERGGDPSAVAGIAFLRNGEVICTPKRPPVIDFDSLPQPDFHLLRYARLRRFPVGWTRGCRMNCEFCTVKGQPRSSSPERVAGQIALLNKEHGARQFFIVDDLFGSDRSGALRLCAMLADYQKAAGIKLDISAQIRLDCGRDEKLLQAMKSAGVKTVCIGYESPVAEELEAMDKRLNAEEMIELTRLYHRAGFFVHGMFIFGYPLRKSPDIKMTTEDRIRCYRQFIRRSRLDTIQVLLPVALPGTALTERLASEGRIFPLDVIGWEYYDGNFPLFMPDDPLTPEEMQQALRKIMGTFYCVRSLLGIILNILTFPVILLAPENSRFGRRNWCRTWRNNTFRFGGWVIFCRWIIQFRRGVFPGKLAEAKERLICDQAGARDIGDFNG